MKKFILLLLVASVSLLAETKWVDSFDAPDVALKEHKVRMVMLTREGCPGCNYMYNVVFNNSDVAKLLKEDFINVDMNVDTDNIPEEFVFFGTPTFYFLDENDKVLKRVDGGKNAKDFLAILKSVKDN